MRGCGWGRGSPGGDDCLLTGFRPRTTGSFLCVPKERNRKKRHPGLCAPKTGVPLLVGRLRRFAQGTCPCAWGERGGSFPRHFVLALRSPSSLGLSKGVQKQIQSHLNPPSALGPRGAGFALVFFLGAFRRAKRRWRRSWAGTGAEGIPRVRARDRGEPEKGGDPVNPRPGERAHHGRCAPVFRAKQGMRERGKALARTP